MWLANNDCWVKHDSSSLMNCSTYYELWLWILMILNKIKTLEMNDLVNNYIFSFVMIMIFTYKAKKRIGWLAFDNRLVVSVIFQAKIAKKCYKFSGFSFSSGIIWCFSLSYEHVCVLQVWSHKRHHHKTSPWARGRCDIFSLPLTFHRPNYWSISWKHPHTCTVKDLHTQTAGYVSHRLVPTSFCKILCKTWLVLADTHKHTQFVDHTK